MATINEILEYVLRTPENINPNILKEMLLELLNSDINVVDIDQN